MKIVAVYLITAAAFALSYRIKYWTRAQWMELFRVHHVVYALRGWPSEPPRPPHILGPWPTSYIKDLRRYVRARGFVEAWGSMVFDVIGLPISAVGLWGLVRGYRGAVDAFAFQARAVESRKELLETLRSMEAHHQARHG